MATAENPNVRPARVWEWTGSWSFVLVLLQASLDWLGGIQTPSVLVTLLLAAIPPLIRWISQKITGAKESFRRLDPPPIDG